MTSIYNYNGRFILKTLKNGADFHKYGSRSKQPRPTRPSFYRTIPEKKFQYYISDQQLDAITSHFCSIRSVRITVLFHNIGPNLYYLFCF